MKKFKTIGIIGGMGPEATADIYLKIVRYFQTKYGARNDNDYPKIIIYSLPIPDIVKSSKNDQEILKLMIESAKSLKKSGCDFVIIACNSVQYLVDQIQERADIKVINIAETVKNYLPKNKTGRIGILATRTTIIKDVYSRYFTNNLMIPCKQTQKQITSAILDQMAGKKPDTRLLSSILKYFKNLGVESLLLACTELPLSYKNMASSIKLIDCTQIYAQQAAELSIYKL